MVAPAAAAAGGGAGAGMWKGLMPQMPEIMKLVSQHFDPKKPGVGTKLLQAELKAGFSLINKMLENSQAFFAVMQPIGQLLGFIMDIIIISFLPEILTLIRGFGTTAKDFMRSAKDGSAFAALIGGLVESILPLITAVMTRLVPAIIEALIQLLPTLSLLVVYIGSVIALVATDIMAKMTELISWALGGSGKPAWLSAGADDLGITGIADQIEKIWSEIAVNLQSIILNVIGIFWAATVAPFLGGIQFKDVIQMLHSALGFATGSNFRAGWDQVSGGMSGWDWASSVTPAALFNPDSVQRRTVGRYFDWGWW